MILKDWLKKLIPEKLRPFVKKLFLRVVYFGNAYYCPVCKSKVRLWKPLGYDFPVIYEKQIVGSGIRNAMCPVCGSSDRVRLLYLFLKNKTNLFTRRIKLLHIAPEDALRDLLLKLKNVDYLTSDLDPGKVMEQMDITIIGYPENSFDAILCNNVLEHIPDDRKAMRELYRVLKPGGWAILQVPVSKVLEETFEDFSITSPQEREKHFGQKDHVRIYGNDYIRKLTKAGFAVETFNWTLDTAFQNEKNPYGLNEDETIFYCTKKV